MKHYFLYLFLLLPLGVLAQRQTSTQSEALWRAGVLPNESQAILSQLAAGSSGTGGNSDISIGQSGSGNRVGLTGSVRANRLDFNQNGNGNQLDLELFGDGNSFGFSQNGSSNVLDLRNVQATGERLDISQQGNGNRLTSDGYPVATGVPVRIEQRGGMQLQITNVR
jgi:hypothetical protein